MTKPLAAALEIQEQVRIGPGDRVLIVGAGFSGIGAAIVRRLVAEGATVAFTYQQSLDAAQVLAGELEAGGGHVLALQADAADADAVAGAVDTVVHTALMLALGIAACGGEAPDRGPRSSPSPTVSVETTPVETPTEAGSEPATPEATPIASKPHFLSRWMMPISSAALRDRSRMRPATKGPRRRRGL